MDTIKTAALTFIAIFACLMLLLTPEPQQNETLAQIPAPVYQDQTIQFEPAPVVVSGQPALVKRDQTDHALENSTPEQTTEAPLVWYPELEQIVLTEDLPIIEAVFELEPMLANHDPVIRLAAIESLGDMTNPATLPLLIAALNDPNPQLRIAALEALASQEDESVVNSIASYLFDQEPEVRLAAIEALEDLEYERSVHALAGLLSDQDVRIRRHAVNALGEIGGKYAISYLLQARYDPDERIRANAEAILDELEDQYAF